MYLIFKIYSRSFLYFRGIMLYLKIILCGGKCAGIPRVGKGVIWKYPPHKGIVFGYNLDIGAYCFFDFPKNATVEIGNNVKLTYNITLAARNKLMIGHDTLIAEYTSLRDSTHGISRSELVRKQNAIIGQITIGSDVWIGRNCLILGDICVNKGVVVGANSLVNKPLSKEYGIYWGVPATLKKERE